MLHGFENLQEFIIQEHSEEIFIEVMKFIARKALGIFALFPDGYCRIPEYNKEGYVFCSNDKVNCALAYCFFNMEIFKQVEGERDETDFWGN